MSDPGSKIILCGILFLFTLLSGIWLSSTGKPYHAGIFTIHKLIALAAVILISVNIVQLAKAIDPRSALLMGSIVLSGLLFLALFMTGALLSIHNPAHLAALRVHQLAPLLVLGSTILAYILLTGTSS